MVLENNLLINTINNCSVVQKRLLNTFNNNIKYNVFLNL